MPPARRQAGRRLPQHQPDLADQRVALCRQRRDLRRDGGCRGLRVGNIELRGKPGLLALHRQVHQLVGGIQVLLRNREHGLGPAKLDVVARHLRLHVQQRGAAGFFRRPGLRYRGFHEAAVLAPEVEVVLRLQPVLVEVVRAGDGRKSLAEQAKGRFVAHLLARVGGVAVKVGVQHRALDLGFGLGLQQALGGDLQVEVLIHSLSFQLRQNRVVKAVPPLRVHRIARHIGARARRGLLGVRWRDSRVRRLEVGAHHAAGKGENEGNGSQEPQAAGEGVGQGMGTLRGESGPGRQLRFDMRSISGCDSYRFFLSASVRTRSATRQRRTPR